MNSIIEDVTATLNALCTCSTNKNQPANRDLWDPEEAEPYFLPQEIREPIIGWDKLTAHCANAQARLVRCFMPVWDINAKLLAPNLAVGLYQMH